MAINSYPDNSGGEVNFPDQLIDPVSKFRVSNPENLIDTDFEYGLQPTKWETVELINNTPSFFSKSGDTTIDGISSIITNAGTREIIVKTELDHGLAVGIPINVTGTKSITADGAYIINSIPDTKTFTYLCKDNQTDTNSILDLYSSIITGEFFQGSQLRISDSDGIVTDAEGTSILTVTTNTTHGFGENTPFYFLNLNSTVAQEFQAANTASKSFDASNSATAQTFDGSNSLSSVSIDWSNSATFGGTVSTITGTSTANDTITVSHTASENFNSLPLGTPLYYSVSATGGYFNTNPRGVVFLKTIDQLGTSSSTFQVSLVPDGDAIDITTTLSGTFQIANQARTFAGNNINPLTQTVLNVEVGTTFGFDGGNQGYAGEVQAEPPNNTLTVNSYDGTLINAEGSSASDHYVGSMVLYTTTGTAATGLTANTTYFITSFTNNSGGNYTFSVAALPGGTPISISGGTGTETFSKIGVSVDKDIVHISESNFSEGDMLEYSFPVDGRFGVVEPEQEKLFYFVDTVYDSHNYKLGEDVGFKPLVATGGTILPDIVDKGRTWKVHQFTTVGTQNFVISDAGKDATLDVLVVAGGGGSGWDLSGGGGGGGVVHLTDAVVPEGTYPIVVGDGGRGASLFYSLGTTPGVNGENGQNSSAFGYVAVGGGGSGYQNGGTAGNPGGSGGGGAGGNVSAPGGASTQPASVSGAYGTARGYGSAGGGGTSGPPNYPGGGGGGAKEAGQSTTNPFDGGSAGGQGVRINIDGNNLFYGGGGGGATFSALNPGGNGGYGGGGGGATTANGFAGFGGRFGKNLGGNGYVQSDGVSTYPPPNIGGANTGGGAGGAHNENPQGNGAKGGSGIVIIRYPITPPVDLEPAQATGGTITEITDSGIIYRVHSFLNTGTSSFVVASPGSWNDFEYLIVAGGGSGGSYVGGGGGGGGFISGRTTLSANTYSIVVGAGGARAGSLSTQLALVGNNGANSSAFGLTAIGGGGGGRYPNIAGTAGGSGGGGGGFQDGSGSGGAGTTAQGFSGGFTQGPRPRSFTGGAGGGGANGIGRVSYDGGNTGGDGGPGMLSTIYGTPYYFGGGGGGGNYTDGSRPGNGGRGGGGGGSSNTANVAGIGGGSALNSGGNGSATGDPNNNGGNGGANTGGGGGGIGHYGLSGAGGSGIVVIRYPIGIA